MKLEKKDVDFFLTYWLKNDAMLLAALEPAEIKLLIDRLVNELSYDELAKRQDTSPALIEHLFESILGKIERAISISVARHLWLTDRKLRTKPDDSFPISGVHSN